MSEQNTSTQKPDQRDKGVGGNTVVVAILLVIAAGTGAWFLMDHGGDMLNKNKGRVFAASFEKECLPKHGSDFCKEVAGVNHSRCLRESANQTDEGVNYDEQNYLTCMRAALDSRSAEQ